MRHSVRSRDAQSLPHRAAAVPASQFEPDQKVEEQGRTFAVCCAFALACGGRSRGLRDIIAKRGAGQHWIEPMRVEEAADLGHLPRCRSRQRQQRVEARPHKQPQSVTVQRSDVATPTNTGQRTNAEQHVAVRGRGIGDEAGHMLHHQRRY